MKNYLLIILTLFIVSNLQSQSTLGIYLNKDNSRESDGKFNITKIRILSDSIFVVNFYSIETKEQFDNFNQKNSQGDYIPVTKGGTYLKKDKYYIFNYGWNNIKVKGYFNKNEKKIIIYKDWENNKIKKGIIYKKLKKEIN